MKEINPYIEAAKNNKRVRPANESAATFYKESSHEIGPIIGDRSNSQIAKLAPFRNEKLPGLGSKVERN